MLTENERYGSQRLRLTRARFGFCPAIRPRGAPPACCLRPDRPPFRPDPAIYSQEQRLKAGQPVSWDSPDITTNLGGGIDENVVVTVRNLSPDSTAAGVDVRVDFSDLGIGMPRTALGFQRTDLAKSGMSGDSRTLAFFVPPSLRGDKHNLAVFVEIQHPTDREPGNNRGEQAWSASSHAAGSNATFRFPIHNRLAGTQIFRVMTLEADWSATLSTSSVTLLPGQSQNVVLSVAIPASFSGRKHFNVVALAAGGALYGGLFHAFDV